MAKTDSEWMTKELCDIMTKELRAEIDKEILDQLFSTLIRFPDFQTVLPYHHKA